MREYLISYKGGQDGQETYLGSFSTPCWAGDYCYCPLSQRYGVQSGLNTCSFTTDGGEKFGFSIWSSDVLPFSIPAVDRMDRSSKIYLYPVTVPEDAKVQSFSDSKRFDYSYRVVDKVDLGEPEEVTLEVISRLVDEGARFGGQMWCRVVEAVISNDLELLTLLEAKGYDMRGWCSDSVGTLKKVFHFCGCQGYTDMLRYLVEHGVDLSSQNCGIVALYASISNNHVDTVKYLLGLGLRPVLCGECAPLNDVAGGWEGDRDRYEGLLQVLKDVGIKCKICSDYSVVFML